MTSSRPGVRRFTVVETREAMEVTAGNLEEVAAWCGGTALRYPEDPDLDRVIARGDVAFAGHVLVRDREEYTAYTREEFERHAAQWEEQGQ